MYIILNKDAATVAVYLSVLQEPLYFPSKDQTTLEEMREHVAFFMLEHTRHELDIASIGLAGWCK